MLAATEIEIPSRLDQAFAKFLSNRTSLLAEQKDRFETIVAQLSKQRQQGHTCIKVNNEEQVLLLQSGFACDAKNANPILFPLVIEDDRLYLQRYWQYEQRLAMQIAKSSGQTFTNPGLDDAIRLYFPDDNDDLKEQRAAIKLACQHAFCIVTGGPGTGKTTTIYKLLAVLQTLADKPLMIALAAPTGKAAMRLQQAVAENITKLNLPKNISTHIPITAYTLHRLLGSSPASPYFDHDASNPLPHDVVIADEASMVDLALMSKLVDALKPGARLFLLGDKDQLASVESGAVLKDLIEGLPNNALELKHAYRFINGIKQLADAVNQQDANKAWEILSNNEDSTNIIEYDQLIACITQHCAEYRDLVQTAASTDEILLGFNGFQVLCSNRFGKYGSEAINNIIERTLFGVSSQTGAAKWYPGRPVMVTQNTPRLRLYNGDIGICLADQNQDGDLKIYFREPDGTIKKIMPSQMPACETAFAITVHKAQGSEYDAILLVLPDAFNPVLTKELIYTAITRAKKRIKITAEKSIFTAAIHNKIGRVTGLTTKISSKN